MTAGAAAAAGLVAGLLAASLLAGCGDTVERRATTPLPTLPVPRTAPSQPAEPSPKPDPKPSPEPSPESTQHPAPAPTPTPPQAPGAETGTVPPPWLGDRSLVVFVETPGLSPEAVIALLHLARRDTRPHVLVRT